MPRERKSRLLTIVARHIGIVTLDQVEQVTLNIQLVGVLFGNDKSHVYGETGSNPVSTVDIAVSDAPNFPPVLTMTVPVLPGDA